MIDLMVEWKIWNIIEEIISEKSEKVQFMKTISSIMFQICFQANHNQDPMLKIISKVIQNFDYKYISGPGMYCHAHKTVTLTPIQHTAVHCGFGTHGYPRVLLEQIHGYG